MDARPSRQHHASVRVLAHIKKLDDCFGQFLVRVICGCGACREIKPEALARLVGWKVTLTELALRDWNVARPAQADPPPNDSEAVDRIVKHFMVLKTPV